ncbi:lysine methyltransferase [Thermanaerothrix daxensis]|uniref:Lysine methyltransferase n=1 Tax=Thermanaerothrix daxensis TaxID=869279 RepID=A0A0P6Y1K7_9CHLR|nr:SET domain-containing protein-lysine N-methyltransferase [Thermanaerothrix daxensis]KPL82822.1 lysine methyltransferase [Thermanaerothrix daxensis]
MQFSTYSYCSPKLELRPCPGERGLGLFAREPIHAGELLAVWGGQVLTGEQLRLLPVERRVHSIQIEEDLYMVPLTFGEPADYFNHSCDPNCGLSSPITLVAMRDIAVGEEACFDYAMSDSSDYDEFECHCGSPNCRGIVTGRDWMLPSLQERYRGYFSPYLQRRIDKMRQGALSTIP